MILPAPVKAAQAAVVGVAVQSVMDRLSRHAIALRDVRDVRDGRTLQDLQHRPTPLLHDIQLHQPDLAPPPRSRDRSERKAAAREREVSVTVRHQPERPSPTYRDRVRNLFTEEPKPRCPASTGV